jgi:hypothetical protein
MKKLLMMVLLVIPAFAQDCPVALTKVVVFGEEGGSNPEIRPRFKNVSDKVVTDIRFLVVYIDPFGEEHGAYEAFRFTSMKLKPSKQIMGVGWEYQFNAEKKGTITVTDVAFKEDDPWAGRCTFEWVDGKDVK